MDSIRTLVVVTPAESQDLITVEDARDELGIENRKHDKRLQRYITQTSAAIAAYTRRVWLQETVQETIYRSYFQSYWNPYWNPYAYSNWQRWRYIDRSAQPVALARYPVPQIVQILEINSDTILDPTEYLLDSDFGLLYRYDPIAGAIFAWTGAETLQVTYISGFADLDDIPPDVQQACLTQIRHRWWAWNRDPAVRSINVPGVQEEAYWVGQIGENGAIVPEAVGLLAPHIDMRM
jgi:hypothetical protein